MSAAENIGSPNESPFAQTADRLVAAGYRPIPLLPREKMPGEWQGTLEAGRWTLMNGWNDFAKRAPTPAHIARWKTWKDANVGVVLGTPVGSNQLICVDFDTDDQDELEQLQSQLPQSRMVKRGQRGYTAFYLAGLDVKTKKYSVPDPLPDQPKKKRCVLEILTGNAPRQTVMPPSMHPFGRPYEYLSHDAIVPIDQLPVLSAEHFEQLEDTLEHMGWNGVDEQRRDRATDTDQATFDDDQNIWRETNNVALQKMHLWVGDLNLPKLRRLPNGSWEAVPVWRPSNSGTPTMQRKANLKFHRDGIRDMGDDHGYTALDVVMEACGCDLDDAFEWLRGRLGLSEEPEFEIPERRMADHGQAFELPPEATNDNFNELPDHLTRPAGLLGDIVDWIEASARSPSRVLALGAAITTLGTVCGRRDMGPTQSGTALYVVMLAPTGSGKQHPLDAVQRLLAAIGADDLIGPSEFMSQTSVIDHLKRAPLSLCPMDEFGDVLGRITAKKAASHEAGIGKLLRMAWGAPFSPVRTPAWANAMPETIHSPAMSILGCATPSAFFNTLNSAQSENGTLNRFLVLSTEKQPTKVKPAVDARNVPPALVEMLATLYRRGRQSLLIEREGPIDAFDIPWADAAAQNVYDAFEEEVDALRASSDGEGDHYARTVETAVRLATVCAAGRDIDDPSVSVDDMIWGRELSIWASRKFARDCGLFSSDTEIGARWSKITRYLQQSGGELTRSALMLKMKLSVRDLDDALKAMTETGGVTIEKTPRADGKPGRARETIRLAQSAKLATCTNSRHR